MKDFFFFSKSQRVGIVLLMVLIALVVAAVRLLPRFFPDENAGFAETEQFRSELQQFRDSLKEQPRYRYMAPRYPQTDGIRYEKQPQEDHYELFAFDPNLADSADFVRLGLRPYIARNILKYRAGGGKFRKPADFSRIYGITEEKFRELEPFIQIHDTFRAVVQADTLPRTPLFIQKKDTVLELNTADTASLQMIRGIGRGYARNIVRYREQLGGYHSVEQLREIPHMTEEAYLRIKDSFTVDTALIEPLRVNQATYNMLNRHPYLTSTQARAVYELRRLKLTLRDWEQLRELDELTDDDCRRLRPYLSFEEP